MALIFPYVRVFLGFLSVPKHDVITLQKSFEHLLQKSVLFLFKNQILFELLSFSFRYFFCYLSYVNINNDLFVLKLIEQ